MLGEGQRKAGVSEGTETVRRGRKADALARAAIDTMEMQILRQILSRVGAREKGRRRKREVGKCKKLSSGERNSSTSYSPSVVVVAVLGRRKVDRFSLHTRGEGSRENTVVTR